MAASGYTPIILFNSGSAGNTPTTGNLAVGELAINYADGKLYYNTGSAIKVLAGAGGAGIAGGSNTQVQYNSSGSLAGSANLTFDGTNLGLSGGTANGVAYLNGSKVLTTGSALVFDGTNLLVGLSSALGSAKLQVNGQFSLFQGNNFYLWSSGNSYAPYINAPGDAIAFYSNSGSEQMRLTSTGLGIGTSSPVTKLDVINNSTYQLHLASTTGNYSNAGLYLGAYGTSDPNYYGYLSWDQTTETTRLAARSPSGIGGVAFYVGTSAAPTQAMFLNTSGNLGLGVTPSAWSGVNGVFEIKGNAYIYSTTGVLSSGANAYFNGSNWIYKTTQAATRYEQVNGTHQWGIAPSGTAGNAISFTQAMTLDNSGNLLLGGTSNAANARLLSENAAGNQLGLRYSGIATWYNSIDSSGNYIWTKDGSEKARIDSSGNFLVGTTSVSGSASNSVNVVGGVFSTASGATSVPTATPTTFVTLPNIGTGVFIISISIAGAGSASTWVSTALVSTQSATSVVTSLHAGSGIVISSSGLSIQVTQTGGTTYSMNWTVIRLT